MAGPAFAMAGVPTGSLGEVRRPLEPIGSVYVEGAEGSARTADERSLPRGTLVRVLRRDGLTVVVEPATHAASSIAEQASRA
jgi:membrane-bound ClpP family serine protease